MPGGARGWCQVRFHLCVPTWVRLCRGQGFFCAKNRPFPKIYSGTYDFKLFNNFNRFLMILGLLDLLEQVKTRQTEPRQGTASEPAEPRQSTPGEVAEPSQATLSARTTTQPPSAATPPHSRRRRLCCCSCRECCLAWLCHLAWSALPWLGWIACCALPLLGLPCLDLLLMCREGGWEWAKLFVSLGICT